MAKTYNVKKMTRKQVLDELYGIAKKLAVKYDYEMNKAMWSLCCDWNSEHYEGTGDEAEIFMCEDEDENGEFRYYIEDDYFYLGE